MEVERRERPQIEIYPSDNQTVVQGGSVLFQCRILSGIPNPEVTWKSLDAGGFPRNVEILANGGVIRITDLQKSNEGRFECTAKNVAGSATAVAWLKVTIAPSLTLTPKGSFQVQAGENIELRCDARGDPVPTVTWTKIDGFM